MVHENRRDQRVVDDQSKALAFYTDVPGFVTKNDVPLGKYRWLTVDLIQIMQPARA